MKKDEDLKFFRRLERRPFNYIIDGISQKVFNKITNCDTAWKTSCLLQRLYRRK